MSAMVIFGQVFGVRYIGEYCPVMLEGWAPAVSCRGVRPL